MQNRAVVVLLVNLVPKPEGSGAGCGLWAAVTKQRFPFQVSESGVHRPHVAGIHGRSNDGAYSLVLAGGYEDDIVSEPCLVLFENQANLFKQSLGLSSFFTFSMGHVPILMRLKQMQSTIQSHLPS